MVEEMDEFDGSLDDPVVAWRAIVLYGLNTATYKIALGRTISNLVVEGQTQISLDQLSSSFLDVYVERLKQGKPQILNAGRLTKMERIVSLLDLGVISRDEAVQRVGKQAFVDVIPRFHTVFERSVPTAFYEVQSDGGLLLTDAAFQVFETGTSTMLEAELASRWDLLETAFELQREPGSLANDIREIYLLRGYERKSVTHLVPVLHGYQEGRCFYCGEEIETGTGHVDHVLPRQFLNHDDTWNLVLAHDFCNLAKSDNLPAAHFVQQLADRNEHLIASSHPLRHGIIKELGRTPDKRRRFVQNIYDDARVVIRREWTGLPGYEPATSPFYRMLVRELK